MSREENRKGRTTESAVVEIPPGAYEECIDDDLHAEWERSAEEPKCIRLSRSDEHATRRE